MIPHWRHILCPFCYSLVEPGRIPVKLVLPLPEICCRCAAITAEPIFYRAEPTLFPCRGHHDQKPRPDL